MKLLSAEFIKSSVTPEQFPPDRLPEIAFVGRSNVGKSSLINSLLHRKKLAKVSKTPGKTRAVNFFTVRTSDPTPLPVIAGGSARVRVCQGLKNYAGAMGADDRAIS